MPEKSEIGALDKLNETRYRCVGGIASFALTERVTSSPDDVSTAGFFFGAGWLIRPISILPGVTVVIASYTGDAEGHPIVPPFIAAKVLQPEGAAAHINVYSAIAPRDSGWDSLGGYLTSSPAASSSI